jgi:hypothetical protein
MVAPQSRLRRPLPPSIEGQQFCSAKSQGSGEGNKTNTATPFPLSLVFSAKAQQGGACVHCQSKRGLCSFFCSAISYVQFSVVSYSHMYHYAPKCFFFF